MTCGFRQILVAPSTSYNTGLRRLGLLCLHEVDLSTSCSFCLCCHRVSVRRLLTQPILVSMRESDVCMTALYYWPPHVGHSPNVYCDT